MKCKKCKKEHDGTFGSGRFCNISCANSGRGYKKGNISWNKGKSSKKIYYFYCIKCDKKYIVKITENYYKKGKYKKHCNWSCSNSKEYDEQLKNKKRIATTKYIKKIGGPRLGKHEKRILDKVEKKYNIKIIRQYHIKEIGYFVDGYCKETNTVYEIDEKPKTKERDIKREKEIKEELNCKFIRIKDY